MSDYWLYWSSNTGCADHELISCHPVTYTDQVTIVLPSPEGEDGDAAHSTLLAAGKETALNVKIKPRYIYITLCDL